MASEWHYTLNGQPAGVPVSSSQLRQLAASGQLQPTDLVWQEGMANWAQASSIKGLFPEKPLEVAGNGPLLESAAGRKGKRKPEPTEADAGGEDEEADDGIHPLVHLLLALLTGGLWGLWVAYSIASTFRRQARRGKDGAGRPLGKSRHPIGVLLLSYLTLGTYFVYWTCATLKECGLYQGGKHFPIRTELTLALIFPPYLLYLVLFRLPQQVRRVQELAGVSELASFEHTILFLNPCVLWALPVLAMAYQNALNQAWVLAP
jgi:hypothetical protein